LNGTSSLRCAATGLDLISGTHDDRIVGNVFTDLGAAGVSLGKFAQDSLTEVHIAYNPTDKNEISTNDTVKNNLVTKVTTEIQGAVGIGAGYPRNVVIEHNEVSYMNYSGISVGFGWTKSSTAMTNNHINWNNVHHVAQLLADAGPIYTLSNQGTGSQIQYNYIHDMAASQWADYWIVAIYLDEGTSGYDVSHNVFSNAPSGVACNSCGTYTASDNAGSAASTISGAGIESAYADIKSKTTIPLPVFSTASTGVEESRIATSAANVRFSARVHGDQLMIETSVLGSTEKKGQLSVYDPQGKLVARYSIGGAMRAFAFAGKPDGRYLAVLEAAGSRFSAAFVNLH
jgi:hypothetical protein